MSRKDYIDDILEQEMNIFKHTVRNVDDETPYYVYWLCFETGVPFYIGKGKGFRAIHHIKECAYSKNESLKDQLINELFDMNCPPVVHIHTKNLTENEAYDLEKEQISYFGRLVDGGILVNAMPGGRILYPEEKLKFRKKHARMAGLMSYESGKGIHGASKEQRSVWAKIGAEGLIKSGNIKGCVTEEYRNNNKEKHRETCSRAGKKGGAARKGWKVWNDGYKNKLCSEWPGPGWSRGRTKSSISQNSTRNFKLPQWTDGNVNKPSEECPGDGFFRGQTCIMKDGTKLIRVFKHQPEGVTIPSGLVAGNNTVGD